MGFPYRRLKECRRSFVFLALAGRGGVPLVHLSIPAQVAPLTERHQPIVGAIERAIFVQVRYRQNDPHRAPIEPASTVDELTGRKRLPAVTVPADARLLWVRPHDHSAVRDAAFLAAVLRAS
jgi:hypothetical protein